MPRRCRGEEVDTLPGPMPDTGEVASRGPVFELDRHLENPAARLEHVEGEADLESEPGSGPQ